MYGQTGCPELDVFVGMYLRNEHAGPLLCHIFIAPLAYYDAILKKSYDKLYY